VAKEGVEAKTNRLGEAIGLDPNGTTQLFRSPPASAFTFVSFVLFSTPDHLFLFIFSFSARTRLVASGTRPGKNSCCGGPLPVCNHLVFFKGSSMSFLKKTWPKKRGFKVEKYKPKKLPGAL
jgi:hypothetical protein